MTGKPEPILWLNDARGIYIPRDFASSFVNRDRDVSGVTAEDWQILSSGPDNRDYWDAWSDVLDCAVVNSEGCKYRLHQDGDLWLIPDGMQWDDAAEWFAWPSE